MSRLTSRTARESLRRAAHEFPVLTLERERELIALAQAGEQAARAELWSSHLRLVLHIAQRYERPSAPLEDLVSEGGIGLLEAIERFDLLQNARLSTYATWWIRARVRDYALRNRKLVALPSTRASRIVRTRLSASEQALAQRLQRSPTRSELAEALEISEDELSSATAALASDASLDGEPSAVTRTLTSASERTPEELVAESQQRELLDQRLSASLARLRERERKIIEAHFLEERASLADLGAELGVTRQRVSQIVTQVRRRLRKELRAVVC